MLLFKKKRMEACYTVWIKLKQTFTKVFLSQATEITNGWAN